MEKTKEEPSGKRIEILDGFRAAAILLVLFYHYLYRFHSISGLYPYGEKYTHNFIINHGYLGVPLFFMISGFVIYLTLERCRTFPVFILRRLARLIPLLLLCSLITFFIVPLLASPNPIKHSDLSWKDFLPGLTFTSPSTWRHVFGGQFSYIDGVYWTLAAEMKYYIMAGLLFFFNRKNFVRNWLIYISLAFTVYCLLSMYKNSSYKSISVTFLQSTILQGIFLIHYLVYFTLGMFFFLLYNKRKIKPSHLGVLIVFVLIQGYLFLSAAESVFYILFICMFSLYVFKPTVLKPFFPPFLTRIGLVSYPLYLIHQNIGVLGIKNLSTALDDKNGLISMFIMVFAVILFSLLAHYKIDAPLQRILKSWILKLENQKKEFTPKRTAELKKNRSGFSYTAHRQLSEPTARERFFNPSKERETAIERQ